ncbi:porin family protein [Algoriphagus sp. PAP.12]|uniref:porin family protein n=1 Tax=Algoriphagus sp. PAP.12 TaxID=2996678 RepID=UPI003FA346CB
MRSTLLVLFLLICGFSAMAQTSVGIRGGFTNATYTYRPAANSRGITAESVGKPTFALVVEHFNSKNAGVELNLQWITLGYKQLNEDLDPIATNITEFNYLKVPFLASFYAGRSGRFQIKMGTHFGYLVNAKDVQREFSDASPAEIPTFGGSDDSPNRFMYGLTGGAGISKLFGKSTLAAEVRFSYDFTNPEGQDRIFDMSSTNLEFSLAYLFKIKDK